MIDAEPGVLVLVKFADTDPPVVMLRERVPPSLAFWLCPVIVKCAVGPVCAALAVLKGTINPFVVPLLLYATTRK